jgi:hypothetical protein
MKTTVLIENGEVKLTFEPENEIERLVIRELGDDVGVSRSHQNVVLRRRGNNVKNISQAQAAEIIDDDHAYEEANA